MTLEQMDTLLAEAKSLIQENKLLIECFPTDLFSWRKRRKIRTKIEDNSRRIDEIHKTVKKEIEITRTIRNTIDVMIDRIYECGVDVSYFPDEAKKIIEETMIKIAEIINNK